MTRVVVLKSNRLYGDLICRHIREYSRHAEVQVFQRGFDALDSMQACLPDLFITGVKIEDMDGLEHLEPFIERPLPILIITSRTDARTFSLLREVRFDGIFDGMAESLANLGVALERVMERELYVSSTFAPHLKRPKNLTLDALTDKEQMVLSIIGDGSDDQQAGEKLRISPHTVNTHRKSIMSKLRLHHKGQIMLYAMRNGYVDVTSAGVMHPGFQRRIRDLGATGPVANP